MNSMLSSYSNNSNNHKDDNDSNIDMSVMEESISLSPYELSLIYDINNSNNSSSSSSSSCHYIGSNSIFPTAISNDYDSILASHLLITTNTIINIKIDNKNTNSNSRINDSSNYDMFIQNCWTIKKSISTNDNEGNCLSMLSKQIELFIKVFLLSSLLLSSLLLSSLSSSSLPLSSLLLEFFIG